MTDPFIVHTGIKVFFHYTFDTNAYRQPHHTMMVADVPLRKLLEAGMFDNDSGDLALTVDLSLTLSDNAFLKVFRSWHWTLVVRIMLSCLSWCVAFIMACEHYEQRRKRLLSPTYSSFGSNPQCQGCIAEMVCAVEGSVCALFGVWLAAGQYGPHTMPLQSHTLFFGFQMVSRTRRIGELTLQPARSGHRCGISLFVHSSTFHPTTHRPTVGHSTIQPNVQAPTHPPG